VSHHRGFAQASVPNTSPAQFVASPEQPIQQLGPMNYECHSTGSDSSMLALGDDSLLDMYCNRDIMLTGADASDWDELERLVRDFEGSPAN
jgi:hypothetical protein